MRAQVALQRFELLTVFEADDVIGSDGLADRNGGLEFLDRSLDFVILQGAQRAMDFSDQLGQIGDANRIVAYIGGDDFGAEFDQIVLVTGRRAGGLAHNSTFHYSFWAGTGAVTAITHW
ncbi:hypothetical protein D9M69_663870 [compost metagenome]